VSSGKAVVSFVGEPYEYDIFFSYPHAIQGALREGSDMRNWSRMIADKLLSLVSIGLTGQSDTPLSYYLDRDRAETGQGLSETLEAATQKSALLVALISPMYKNWCLKELEWFCAGARNEPPGPDQLVPLEVMQTADDKLPERLRDRDGERRYIRPLTDGSGMPLDLASFMFGGATPELADPLNATAQEVIVKLSKLRSRLQAQRTFAAIQAPPARWMLYLDAEPQDQADWLTRRNTLTSASTVVLPTGLSPDATAGEPATEIYKDCDALILLHSRAEDRIFPRLRRAYLDRRLVYQAKGKNLYCAILNSNADAPIEYAKTFGTPCIDSRADGWVDTLMNTLVAAASPATPP
jgi:hypothetical protein